MRLNIVGIILTLAFGLLMVPLVSDAQPPAKVPRIGVLSRTSPFLGLEAFQQGLRELGWVEGQTIALEIRAGEHAPLPDLAAELVRLQVDVIVTLGTPAALAARARPGRFPSSWPVFRIRLSAGSSPASLGLGGM
ncbi:MAG: hypothetical protein HYZ81_08150 [Nitrospinae bacterium]|nr:hypothetical protein [Nitrospinota bacterium]